MPRTSPLKLEPKGDMKQLKKLFKESPVVILVVFANWCGHCQTMKKNVWDPMCKRKKVNANNVAAVESSVLESAGKEGQEIMKNVQGFPSVLEVVNGKITKTLPPPKTVNEFEELVNTASAMATPGAPGSTPFPKATSAAAVTAADADVDIYNQTEPPVQESPFQEKQGENNASSSLFTMQSRQYTPQEDILTRYNQEQEQKPFTGGGNLYSTMRNISSGILPAGTLGLAAIAMRGGRRRILKKKTRKAKKSKKTTRRRH